MEGVFHRDNLREYLRCAGCDLVFVPPEYHLSAEEERARYDQHNNDPRDPGYRAFLSRLAVPLAGVLEPGSVGLDFGCGPGPALSSILGEMGFTVHDYDPMYRDDPRLLERTYDFVAATETVEHFARPAEEFALMRDLVRAGGWLGVMTAMTDGADFGSWHYRRDPTHVSFFSRETFRWIAERFAFGEVRFREGGVVLLRRP